jgi:hypothetical protein
MSILKIPGISYFSVLRRTRYCRKIPKKISKTRLKTQNSRMIRFMGASVSGTFWGIFNASGKCIEDYRRNQETNHKQVWNQREILLLICTINKKTATKCLILSSGDILGDFISDQPINNRIFSPLLGSTRKKNWFSSY